MMPIISLDNQTLEQLQRDGEVKAADSHDLPLVVMTAAAHEKLRKLVYDDGDWSAEELQAVAARWLNDPEGWGAPGMEIYDELYGDESIGQGNGA